MDLARIAEKIAKKFSMCAGNAVPRRMVLIDDTFQKAESPEFEEKNWRDPRSQERTHIDPYTAWTLQEDQIASKGIRISNIDRSASAEKAAADSRHHRPRCAR